MLLDYSSDECMVESDTESVNEQQITKDMLKIRMFVLVEYIAKKSSCYYIAQLEGIAYDLLVDCLGRVGNTNHFRKPDVKDSDMVDIGRIKKIMNPSIKRSPGRAVDSLLRLTQGWIFDRLLPDVT